MRKHCSNDLGHLLFFIIVSLREVGAFTKDLTTNLAPECRAFSSALKIEKIKGPLFRGHIGAGDTNDWCINTNIMYIITSTHWFCPRSPFPLANRVFV